VATIGSNSNARSWLRYEGKRSSVSAEMGVCKVFVPEFSVERVCAGTDKNRDGPGALAKTATTRDFGEIICISDSTLFD